MKYKCPKCGKEIGITEDIMDQQVVERFNELWSDNRVAAMPLDGKLVCSFALVRPTPRYRPFTAVEAAWGCFKPINQDVEDMIIRKLKEVSITNPWAYMYDGRVKEDA